MGINIFSPTCGHAPGLAFFLARLHALKSLLTPTQKAKNNSHYRTNQAPKNGTVRSCAIDTAAWRFASNKSPKKLLPIKSTCNSQLKIVREFEPGVDTSYAGRMVISGRMADVCAELDRMTQLDAHANGH